MPERIRSLVLVEPVLLALLRTQGEHAAYVEVSQIAQDCVSAGPGRAAGGGGPATSWTTGAASASGRAWPTTRGSRVERAIPSVARQWEAIFADPTPLAEYAGLRMPTLLLAGDHGPVPPAA